MTKERNKFIKRAEEAGYEKKTAENVFALIERFAGYGFNKAHSTGYAMIAYQTAYLKAHWTVEFMAALLTAESSGNSGPDRDEKVALAIEECLKMKVKILPPDINQSKVNFSIEDEESSLGGKAIRFGFAAIKNVGGAAISAILEAREAGGDFKSIFDFCQRVDGQKVNKKVLESLIRVGAMSMFGKRAALLSSLEKIRSKGNLRQKEKANGQFGLFDSDPTSDPDFEEKIPEMEEFSQEELLSLEKDLLGLYLTEHPLNRFLPVLAAKRSHKIEDLLNEENHEKDKLVKVGGMINSLRVVLTKANAQEMAFVRIEDESGSLEAVVFPKLFSHTKDCWIKNQMVLLKGRLQIREDNPNLVVEEVKLLEKEQIETTPEKPEIKINDWDFEISLPSQLSPRKLVEINKLLKQNQGQSKLSLAFVDHLGRVKKLALPFGVDYSPELEEQIKKIIEE